MALIRERETEPGDDAPDDGYGPQDDGYGDIPQLPDFDIIIGAPDFTTLIKRPQSANAKDYTKKIGSALKAVAIGSIQAHNFPDAATILWHGPGAATALGTLCDEEERVAKMVDMLTSPSNPWTACALAMMPLVSQLVRNHEKEIQQLPSRWRMGREARQARREAKQDQPKAPARFHIRIGKRTIPIRVKAHIPFVSTFIAGARGQTQEPNVIAAKVFMDPNVLKSLEKLGIVFRQAPDE